MGGLATDMPQLPASVIRSIKRCTWCRHRFVPERAALILGATFSEWPEEARALRGTAIRLRLSQVPRTITGVVPREGTAAMEAGYDMLFVVCSDSCKSQLADSIRGEMAIVSALPKLARARLAPVFYRTITCKPS